MRNKVMLRQNAFPKEGKMKRKLFLSLAAVIVLTVGLVAGGLLSGLVMGDPGGSVPSLINYQGSLLDPSTGDPVADGPYSITFSIYSSAVEVLPMWQETQTVVVQDGLFSVMLGSVWDFPPNLFDGSERYLGVKVGTDAEMTPRQLLATVPYAFMAENAETLDGMDSADFVAVTGDTMTGTLNLPSNGLVAGGNQLVLANYRVGIMTGLPMEDLDVGGTVQVEGFKMPPGASSGYVLTSDASGVGTWQAAGAGTGISCPDCDDRFVEEGQPNSITAGMVEFDYAGSSTEGGPANDLSCMNCVSAAEVNFNYAGSSSQGGSANDVLSIEDALVGFCDVNPDNIPNVRHTCKCGSGERFMVMTGQSVQFAAGHCYVENQGYDNVQGVCTAQGCSQATFACFR